MTLTESTLNKSEFRALVFCLKRTVDNDGIHRYSEQATTLRSIALDVLRRQVGGDH